jgi:lipopolysaccharide/colanic/teichoic acid biosynthesis glycosyltransferase
MTFDERLRLDIEYVRTISLGLDLKIIARTVISAFSTPGA